jgi:hypothetical protein
LIPPWSLSQRQSPRLKPSPIIGDQGGKEVPFRNNRCRENNGEIRHKNGSTLVGTLRRTYGDDFAHGMRSDMKLDTLLARTSSSSLSEYLKKR